MEECDGIEAVRREMDDLHQVLVGLRAQSTAQHDEHVVLLTKLTDIAQKQLDIGLEYKTYLGDPLRRGSLVLSGIRTVFAWVAGAALTYWGLKEIFDSFFVPRIKP